MADSTTYVDLAHGHRAYPLGKIGSFAMRLSDNGATLLMPQLNGSFTAYDLTKGGAPIRLPPDITGRDFHLSPDGSALAVVRKNGTGVVLPLRGRLKTPMELGDVHQTQLTLSDTGSAVLAGDQHTPFTFFDLAHGARGTTLGRLASKTGLDADGAYAFTSDGSLLLARDEDGTGAVYDLSGPSPAVDARGGDLAGKSLVENVCQASGSAIRSFPANVREAGGQEQSNAIARSLIGRPWNPLRLAGPGSRPGRLGAMVAPGANPLFGRP